MKIQFNLITAAFLIMCGIYLPGALFIACCCMGTFIIMGDEGNMYFEYELNINNYYARAKSYSKKMYAILTNKKVKNIIIYDEQDNLTNRMVRERVISDKKEDMAENRFIKENNDVDERNMYKY